jgi:DNA-binding beta-propeller fold protein YncE
MQKRAEQAKSLMVKGSVLLMGLNWCQNLYADSDEYITTMQPTVLLSVNDGESIALVSGAGESVRTDDSVTVIRLFNDRPPEIKTVYGTTSSTIIGSPYAAIVGRFGIVTNHDDRLGEPVSPEVTGRNQIVAIDLESDNLSVTSRIELDAQPWLAIAHPDGRRVIVALSDHWRVLEVRDDGSLVEAARSPSVGVVYSFDVSNDGKTIIAAMVKGTDVLSDETGIFRFTINDDSSITVDGEITSEQFEIDGPFSPRISPDGTRALVLNSLGFPDGVLDDVLVVNLADNTISHVIPQVADGLESLAFHPSGEFAVVACLDDFGPTMTSHLAVVDLKGNSPQVLYHLPVERVPEGIEFTPDGTKLFVGSTEANHLAVFDVDGTKLVRSPYVLPTGYGHSLLGISTN